MPSKKSSARRDPKPVQTHIQQVAFRGLTASDLEFILHKVCNDRKQKIFSDYIQKYHPKNSSSSIHFEKKTNLNGNGNNVLPKIGKRPRRVQNKGKYDQKLQGKKRINNCESLLSQQRSQILTLDVKFLRERLVNIIQASDQELAIKNSCSLPSLSRR